MKKFTGRKSITRDKLMQRICDLLTEIKRNQRDIINVINLIFPKF